MATTANSEQAPTSASQVIGRDKDPFLAEETPSEAMMARFDHAAQLLALDPGLYRVLRQPEKQLIVSVPIQRDNGEIDVFTGYRVLHNTSRGPAKGGIRFDKHVTLDEVKALAAWMTWKGGCATPRWAAPRGGVVGDPTPLPITERDPTPRRYTSALM